PSSIERMKTGICNEVFAFKVEGESYILRMNNDISQMRGSSLFTPKLAALDIQVPRIIADEYNIEKEGYGYQIQERLPGTDLGNVIQDLAEDQLKKIAKEIASIFKKLSTLPTDGSYGLVLDENGAKFSSWKEWVYDDLDSAERHARSTGFISEIRDLIEQVRAVVQEYEEYFFSVPSTTYYGDIAGKNVLIEKGTFTGLVDLDALAYGDPLEAVGRIYTSWHGTEYGKIYSDAVMDELELTKEQRDIVRMYALFHRFAWMCENGVAFNANTSGIIDAEEATKDREKIQKLLEEIERDS
ncbi:hypothetical protein COV05_00130, partial [Candidatus Uhrbacteria bacterium CG10_big_fil_rev_8_21_14_0_10_48_16]